MVNSSHRCPLCGTRRAKRFCPAKLSQICPVCCGTKREVEIDCPSDCVYLQSGRQYEGGKKAKNKPNESFTERLWSQSFQSRNFETLLGLWSLIRDARSQIPELVDIDVREVLNRLIQTYQTQEGGIYYDHLPESYTQKTLYSSLKSFLEGKQNQENLTASSLKTENLLDCLQLTLEMAVLKLQSRPKSRAFLDQLSEIVAKASPTSSEENKQSGIILP